jgi:hypothetical protein
MENNVDYFVVESVHHVRGVPTVPELKHTSYNCLHCTFNTTIEETLEDHFLADFHVFGPVGDDNPNRTLFAKLKAEGRIKD